MTGQERDPPFPDGDTRIPRFREAGEITLDLVHRDGRVADRWLGFRPREFELLWKLAEQPGERMTRRQLLQGAWRLGLDSEGGSLPALVARIRTKLAPFGLSRLVASHARGGYFLDPATGHGAFGIAPAPSA